MYFPIDETHPESSASRTSSFSRAPICGFEIGIKLFGIDGLLDRSDEGLESLPLSFFCIACRHHFVTRTGDGQPLIGTIEQGPDPPYGVLRRPIGHDRLAIAHALRIVAIVRKQQ